MYTIILVCFCIGIAAVDIKTCRIPDVLLAAFALAVSAVDGGRHCGFAAALFALAVFGAVWHYSGGMGLGDVKYAAVLGYSLGFGLLVPALIVTAVLGIGTYLVGMLLFRWPKNAKIPFAPFLSTGAIAAAAGGMITGAAG